MNILIIDDESEIVKMFYTYLSAHGHTCTSETDGAIGLDLIQNKQFDVIILDLAMPGFTGHDIITNLDKIGILEQQKIILCTASSMPGVDIEDLKKMNGVKRVIKKPVSLTQLLKTVEEIHLM